MRVLLTLLMCCFVIVTQAQVSKLKGSVLNESREFIPGATIAIKGTRTAVTTDAKGSFSINVEKFPCVIVCSAIGMQTQELTINDAKRHDSITFVLMPSVVSLAEVVVTGYAKSSRSDFSSDMSSMSVPPSAARESARAEHKSSGAETKREGYSKILTAGELSDFKKWKLWSDYSEGEFSSMQSLWNLGFQKRYCVQIQNKEHRPVVAEKVQLMNRDTREVIWTTYTDNTGKAELWSDYETGPSGDNNYILAGDEMVADPLTFEAGINRIVLKRNCGSSADVDIAFVVDATGSMGDEISYLQAELQDIIAKTAEDHRDIKLRLASVFYRDRGDEYLTRQIDFQSDPSAAINFIREQRAGGGGDFPEAVDAALDVALDSLHWRVGARTKIMFLVLDAPPHDQYKETIKAQIARAASMGIRIVPIACSGVDKSTEYLLRCAALGTNGSYIFLTDDSGVGNAHIKPTTDDFKVEILNDLLQRVIGEMIFVSPCTQQQQITDPIVTSDTGVLVTANVFPNPTSGHVTLESSVTIRQLLITDFAGKVLEQVEPGKRKRRWSLSLSPYPSGTYLIRYFTDEKGWAASKIVLIH